MFAVFEDDKFRDQATMVVEKTIHADGNNPNEPGVDVHHVEIPEEKKL